MSKTKIKKPPKCCYPNCFDCPYVDCRYDRLEVEDFTETNNRDYFLHYDSTGEKLHKPTDKDYRNARITAYQRRVRKSVTKTEYNKEYYQKHREEILQRQKENYNKEKNIRWRKKYSKKNKQKRKEYDREYYLKHREEKLKKAKEEYQKKKLLK